MNKTREDIEALKINWLKDPIWDIEETEGFEDHKEELLAFHKEQQVKWDARAEEMRIASFEHKKHVIEDEIEGLEAFISDLPASADYYQLRISGEQVMATVLLAEQVKRVADLLQAANDYDQYIRGN